MCCLRYEYGTYAEEIAKTPRVDSTVETPDGIGVVTEISPLAGLVKVRLQNNPDQPPQLYHRSDTKQLAKQKPDQNENGDNVDNDTDAGDAELQQLEDN